MTEARKNTNLIPLVLVTSLFFLWAFVHNLEPILIPHLKVVFSLKKNSNFSRSRKASASSRMRSSVGWLSPDCSAIMTATSTIARLMNQWIALLR